MVQVRTRKFAFEIYWPLDILILPSFFSGFVLVLELADWLSQSWFFSGLWSQSKIAKTFVFCFVFCKKSKQLLRWARNLENYRWANPFSWSWGWTLGYWRWKLFVSEETFWSFRSQSYEGKCELIKGINIGKQFWIWFYM